MDIKELLGFLECEKMERFQKVDSRAVNSASTEFMDCHAAAATAAARNDSKQLTQTLLAMTIKRR